MKFSNLIYEEPSPFSDKREFNWKAIKVIGVTLGFVCVVGLLCMPAKESPVLDMRDNAQKRDMNTFDADETTFIDSGNSSANSVRTVREASKAKDSQMIVSRGGLDFKSSAQPGRKIKAKLITGVTISQNSMPVIAVAIEDLEVGGFVAIPRDSEIFGEARFDSDLERAQFTWSSVKMPNGRERAISAVTIGLDGKEGVEGKIRSNSTSNAIGQTISRFVGSYAEGSIERMPFNGSRGGHVNGLRTAVSETAKDRAEKFADDLKKERSWIELTQGKSFFVILNQPFVFRDPGGTN